LLRRNGNLPSLFTLSLAAAKMEEEKEENWLIRKVGVKK
jgi:hypothetical protein